MKLMAKDDKERQQTLLGEKGTADEIASVISFHAPSLVRWCR